MITLQNLGKSYGARSLFSDVSLRLSTGARYGLVGANGSGKTTLLNMLAGDEAASENLIQRLPNARIGVLRQDRFDFDDAEIIFRGRGQGAIAWCGVRSANSAA